MSATTPTSSLQLRSLIRSNGELEVSLQTVAVPEPAADEVLVRIEATPINPSDLGLLFGAADMSTAVFTGTPERPVLTARVPEERMPAMAGRADESMPVGNEGAGVVVRAGSGEAAQALLGKTVAMIGGAMFAQHRCVPVAQCLPLPPGTTPAEGASCFVNPLTALGMVETMKREGHTALVHTARVQLGQMLNRICIKDGIGLRTSCANPSRQRARTGRQARLQHQLPNFLAELTEALAATGATIAFDAIGGGKPPGQILNCMEAAINRNAKEYSCHGSAVHKQVYLYGMLDPAPTEFGRSFGMAWGMGLAAVPFPDQNRAKPPRKNCASASPPN
ncbi:MAG: NADH oxidase [Burkholderiaceae bacterium]